MTLTIKEENGMRLVRASELKEWEKNPRTTTPADVIALREQVDKLGMFKPVLIMEDGTVIGGNRRLGVYREKGYEWIWFSMIETENAEGGVTVRINGALQMDKSGKPRTYKSREQVMFVYAMADNDHAGSNVKKKVTELAIAVDIKSVDVPIKINFGKGTEVTDLLGETGNDDKPEIQFTEELLEEHNYLVLYFDNEIDWLQLQSLYKLPSVKSLDSKPGFTKVGIGRVVRGADFLKAITGK